jgi:hypothetical protein
LYNAAPIHPIKKHDGERLMLGFNRQVVICLISLLMLPALATAAAENTLKPFTTDGCSMWLDGYPSQPNLWRHCCVTHDKAYWIGGPQELRTAADENLRACVTSAAGKGMGGYMHFFVSTGGSPLWFTPYRWGYGWSYLENGRPRGYKTLTPEELLMVAQLEPDANRKILLDAESHLLKK